MNLIIKPLEACNFKCTFCSSTDIADSDNSRLGLDKIFRFLDRFPNTSTIIVNGGEPLLMDPEYYWAIIRWLDDKGMKTSISFTTNLWAFYKKPSMWVDLFKHPRVGVTTSFQYGEDRRKGDTTVYTESDFWKVSDLMLDLVGYRPDFISVISSSTPDPIRNVELAKTMDVECKLNLAMSSGPPTYFKGIKIGQRDIVTPLSRMYALYISIYDRGLMQWEYNTKQMVKSLQGYALTCPQNRQCDTAIRVLQPDNSYYSCGSFGDDKLFPIDYDVEMNTDKIHTPLSNNPDFISLKQSCLICPMFSICNGCRKTMHDMKRHGVVEEHCFEMKKLASRIIDLNNLSGAVHVTPYVKEE